MKTAPPARLAYRRKSGICARLNGAFRQCRSLTTRTFVTNKMTPRGVGQAGGSHLRYLSELSLVIVRQRNEECGRTGTSGAGLVSVSPTHEELRLPAAPRDVFHTDEHEVIQAQVFFAYGPHSITIGSALGALSVLWNMRKHPLKKHDTVMNVAGHT